MTSPARPPGCGTGFLVSMEIDMGRQGLCLLAALLSGAGCGLAYDLLRPLRRLRCSTADGLFALLCFVVAFLLGQGVCGGRLGIFELGCLGLGFWGYRRIRYSSD